MTIADYISSINRRYVLGNATEHTFRGDLQNLIENMVPAIRATNEPKRQSCGAPDFILTRKDIPVGFIEAKDIGDKDLDGKKKTGNKEQFDRYKASLNNLIFTDYLDFHLYRDGILVATIAIGEVVDGRIKPLTDNYASFQNLMLDFCTHIGQTIKSPKKLAQMMAGKARLLSEIIERSLNSDEATHEDSTLKDQMGAFKEILIHDITAKGFADVYAQTIAYGMFAARLHDPSLDNFTRQEAAELIPKSNPFLRKLFGYIAGPDIDDRIKWIVDSLADVFLACNVADILKDYGKETKMEDPIIHFYETFLSEYDPALRKARGVWYTPAPVVNFIVRAVDDILKTEFDLPMGLADTSKTTIKLDSQTRDKRSPTGYKQVEQEVHKVQILDPATGTGTFIAEVIKHIHQKFKGQQGIWSNYVENHLIPRLNGFELLMASYAMAHLKLDLLLAETGFTPTKNQRFRVFLTNSLEEYNQDTGTLFANWLSTEANEANAVKRDTPVMVVMGNPPYAVSSTNKGEWIQNLISDYKKNLNERKLNLDDDYIKFIRYAQHFIDKNGTGVLAYISNNSFIDGITHRQMRKSLLDSFDKLYILDLHGNSKKKEVSPDGSIDQNVFDIMQGVSINVFVKVPEEKTSPQSLVLHKDVFGNRLDKYNFLISKRFSDIDWTIVNYTNPNYFFVPKDFVLEDKYLKYFSLASLFKLYSTGIESKCDEITMQFSKNKVHEVVLDFNTLDEDSLILKYLRKNSAGWNYGNAKTDLKLNNPKVLSVSYRPFDIRFTAYTGVSSGFLGRPRSGVNNHMLKPNIGFCTTRSRRNDSSCYFLTKFITDKSISSSLDNNYVFPLYLYSDNDTQQTIDQTTRRPNLNPKIVNQIAEKLGLDFTAEKVPSTGSATTTSGNENSASAKTFAPIDILDYIYAVLHSPTYREKYKEFLKIDFPRVPYPKNAETFWKLVAIGAQIRQIHLLESPVVEQYITQYPIDGDNVVERPKYKDGKVFINTTQYFDQVPEIAWNFYIGGYQPAQKWLKDRKGRTLNFEDILHYQKIIVALSETDRLMGEVDLVGVE